MCVRRSRRCIDSKHWRLRHREVIRIRPTSLGRRTKILPEGPYVRERGKRLGFECSGSQRDNGGMLGIVPLQGTERLLMQLEIGFLGQSVSLRRSIEVLETCYDPVAIDIFRFFLVLAIMLDSSEGSAYGLLSFSVSLGAGMRSGLLAFSLRPSLFFSHFSVTYLQDLPRPPVTMPFTLWL